MIKSKPLNYKDCVKIGRLKFEHYFSNNPKQLLYLFPLNHVVNDTKVDILFLFFIIINIIVSLLLTLLLFYLHYYEHSIILINTIIISNILSLLAQYIILHYFNIIFNSSGHLQKHLLFH